MKSKKISQMYKTMEEESFPEEMSISFTGSGKTSTLKYEKVTWNIEGVTKGLRYGENPGQPAALYRLVNGNISIAECEMILPGEYLASDIDLLQSGKHPGKTNITDVDNALNILRYFGTTPCSVIVKHNNPCGVAKGDAIGDAYEKALYADRIAAFGGAVACNRSIDRETARFMTKSYIEVVAAPDFDDGVLDIFAEKKNLRVIKIGAIDRLASFIGKQCIDFTSLIDGGIICQSSFSPRTLSPEDLIPAAAEKDGREVIVDRRPTPEELGDMMFGWLVETGITSNSVIYVKDGVTVGIGTGEQDRVGVAEIARDKAYKKTAERISWLRYQSAYADLDEVRKTEVWEETAGGHGGLDTSVMVSDAFFPFRDGVEVGLREGVSAVIQPGGAIRDADCIEACNEYGAAMMFTGQRCFKH
jgi:phosphoribosylaminoimidazolecarboxamide formyltransferase / IMP cyclohydrolase